MSTTRTVRESTATRTRTRVSSTGGTTMLAVRGLSFWRRQADRFGRAWRVVAASVQPGGWFMLAAGTAGLGVGLRLGITELVAAGVAALTLLALAIPFLARARPYTVDFALDHDRVTAGGSARVEVQVRNDTPTLVLPGVVDVPVGSGIVEVAVPLLRRGAQHIETVTIPTPRRGIIEIGPLRSVRADPLALLRREATWAQTRELFVHPRTSALPTSSVGFIRDLEGQASADLVDADISFHAIREYVPGDAQRQVHWKSTAKTGTLMVRQFEQTRRSRMLIAIDRDRHSYRDDDEFELAISAAASLGVRGVRDGRDVHVVTGEDVPEFARTRLRAIRDLPTLTQRILLDSVTGLELLDTTNPLAEVAGLAIEAHPDVSLAFVVTGSTVNAAALRRAWLSFPTHVGVAALVCDGEAEPRARRLGEIAVLTIGVLGDLPQLMRRGAQS